MTTEPLGAASHIGDHPMLERMWTLRKSEQSACAETALHPFGYEVRVYLGGCFLFSFTFPTRALAERLARKLRLAGLAAGWTEQPSMSA